MNWIKKMITRLATWWLGREQDRLMEIGAGLADHLEEIALFSQGDYKTAYEGVPELFEQFARLEENTSGIEEETRTARESVEDVAKKLPGLRRGLHDAYKAIKKAADDGEDFECLVQNAEELREEYKNLADVAKNAIGDAARAVKETEEAMSDVKKVTGMAKEISEKWVSTEQKLAQMVERGGVLVSTAAINNVAERFRDVARRQGYKIFCLWVGLFGLAAIVVWVSVGLWNNVNGTGAAAVDNLPLFLSLRSAIFGVLTALIIFLYRAIKPAEEERREYQKKGTVLASSMAVHKESLSAPLQRVIAEELGWRSEIKRLNIFLKEDNTLCVENLLAEEVNVSGYEVICWDEEGRRVSDIPNILSSHEVLAGHEELMAVEVVDINMVRRAEIRDTERNVVARWAKPLVKKRRNEESD